MRLDDALQAATADRLEKMASYVPAVPLVWVNAAMTTDLYNRLSFVDNIDTGEAALALIALHCEHDNKLVTGDKRFITSMAAKFPAEYERLKPLVVTFERCLLAVCEAKGYEHVMERLLSAKECDVALRSALGSDG